VNTKCKSTKLVDSQELSFSRVHLGQQKEAFDAEMYAMSEAVKIVDEICEKKEVRRVTIFTDSQATL